MEFRLYYRGGLRANGSAGEKQRIRRSFHPQLKRLWEQPRPPGFFKTWFVNNQAEGVINRSRRVVGNFVCMPLVSESVNLAAELDILFLRPQQPGSIINSAGDIDNRLKTLLDALRIPKPAELTATDIPSSEENPLFCLLEDDILVTRIAVTTDRLLDADERSTEVVLVIHVLLKEGGYIKDFWPGLQ